MYPSFSDKQLEVIAHAVDPDHTSIFAGGAVRSGKTTASAVGFAAFTTGYGRDSEHFLVGQSVEVVMRNVGYDLLRIYETLGIRAVFTRTLGSCIIVPYKGRDVRVWVIGASDERSQKRIQGSTAKGMLIDEVPVLPEGFFNMAWSRLSEDGAKLWGTYNPEGPRHWFKQTILNYIERYEGKLVRFGLDDNPSLTHKTKDRYRKSFTGHWFKRLIKGEWAGATGLIFPVVKTAKREPKGLDNWAISVDFGVSSVFAALAFKFQGRQAHCLSELYDDVRKDETKTEDERIAEVVKWADGLGIPNGTPMWVDPSTPNTFKRKLREAGFRVRLADNDVIPGLITTAARLASGEITINDGCTCLLEEIGTYSWDDKKTEVGEDAPKKAADHACDALRYYAHSTGKSARMMRLQSIQETLKDG